MPLQAAFREAVSFIEEIGVQEIEERNLQLAARLKRQLSDIPAVQVYSPMEPDLSSGLVSFVLSGWDPPAVVERLWNDHRIVVRQVGYPAGIRASLHFFNTEDEVDQLAQAVKGLA